MESTEQLCWGRGRGEGEKGQHTIRKLRGHSVESLRERSLMNPCKVRAPTMEPIPETGRGGSKTLIATCGEGVDLTTRATQDLDLGLLGSRANPIPGMSAQKWRGGGQILIKCLCEGGGAGPLARTSSHSSKARPGKPCNLAQPLVCLKKLNCFCSIFSVLLSPSLNDHLKCENQFYPRTMRN